LLLLLAVAAAAAILPPPLRMGPAAASAVAVPAARRPLLLFKGTLAWPASFGRDGLAAAAPAAWASVKDLRLGGHALQGLVR
jgi:hypothetical protein